MIAESKDLEAMMPVEATQLVDDVMRRWPATIRVFLNHKMHCVGCPITCFHTVADACREHDVDQVQFLMELSASIGEQAGCEPLAVGARWPA